MQIVTRGIGHALSLSRRFAHLRAAAQAAGLTTYTVPYTCVHWTHAPVRITATGGCKQCAERPALLASLADEDRYLSAAELIDSGLERGPVSLEAIVSEPGVCRPNDAYIRGWCAEKGVDPDAATMEEAGFVRAELPHKGMWRVLRGRTRFACASCYAAKNAKDRASRKRIGTSSTEVWDA